MTATANTSRIQESWPWWRWGLLSFNLVALGLTAYLSWHHLVGGAVLGCDGGSPCDQVLSSRWSSIAGIVPVTGLAAGVYLAMLVAGFYVGPTTEAATRWLAWRAMLVFAGAVAGSAVWFTIVQKFIIHTFCPYCLAAHGTGLVLAALVIWQGRRQAVVGAAAVPAAAKSSTAVPAPRILRWAVLGFFLAGIMVVAQTTITAPPEYRAGQTEASLPPPDWRSAPRVGPPTATNIVSLLFDYKCPHCQQLHFMLDEAVRRAQGSVAFVLCPTPLNPACNPYIPRDVPSFTNSCELARVALTVWVARPEVFPDFERWMFSMESGDVWHPRSLAAAQARAIALVGPAQFAAARSNPWIDRYLEACLQIYGKTTQSGNNAVPKLVYNSRWVVPQPDDVDELLAILRNGLGVRLP